VSKIKYLPDAAERHFKRTGHGFQVRTAAGRLVASAPHVEAVQWMVHEGRNRYLLKRTIGFGKVYWA
jgi:hypothetical protein